MLRHVKTALEAEYEIFCQQEAEWLDDYALFRDGKEAHGGVCLLDWEDDLVDPTP